MEPKRSLVTITFLLRVNIIIENVLTGNGRKNGLSEKSFSFSQQKYKYFYLNIFATSWKVEVLTASWKNPKEALGWVTPDRKP